jgi:transposase InsO family protein
MADHMRTELVSDALQMALARRRPDRGLIWHSDQGSQFVSLAFGQQARKAGIAQSMGSKGDCFDNAVAESFFATIKKELIQPPRVADQERAAHRGLRLHRDLLQPRAPPQHARATIPRRLRERHSEPEQTDRRRFTAPIP